MSEAAASDPEGMRGIVRDYVWTVHTTYLDHVRHLPPGERAALPLMAAQELTVVAAASRQLHLIATTDALPAPQGPEVEVADEYQGIRWRTRFFDPSVLPDLGVLADDQPAAVRKVLGVSDTVYHLSVAPGGGLTGHHAQHSGVALANQHAKTLRELDRLRQALPRAEPVVDELGVCVRLGLDRAAGLLVTALSAGRVTPEPGTAAAACLDALSADLTRSATGG